MVKRPDVQTGTYLRHRKPTLSVILLEIADPSQLRKAVTHRQQRRGLLDSRIADPQDPAHRIQLRPRKLPAARDSTSVLD